MKDITPAKPDDETKVHPLVLQKTQEIRLQQNEVVFSGECPAEALKADDYVQFLSILQAKFANSGVNKTLNTFKLMCRDRASLIGVKDFVSKPAIPSFPFQCLVVDFSELSITNQEEKNTLFNDLKNLLSALSASPHQLSELKLIDPKQYLNASMIDGLTGYINDNNIALTITLPDPFKTNQLAQKTIDEATSDFMREKAIKALNTTEIDRQNPVQAPNKPPGAKRTRPRNSSKTTNPNIEIEVQQEREQERAQQVELHTSPIGPETKGDSANQGQQEDFLDFEAFKILVTTGGFEPLIPRNEVDEHNIDQLWRNWVGALSSYEITRFGEKLLLSKTTCHELLRHRDRFPLGLDLKNLPAGFGLKKTPDGKKYIDFDENLKSLTEYNPLQVQTTPMPGSIPLTHKQWNAWFKLTAQTPQDSTEQIIRTQYDKIQQMPYHRARDRLFKQYLPQMLMLDSKTLNSLFTNFNFEQVDTWFDFNFQSSLNNALQEKSKTILMKEHLLWQLTANSLDAQTKIRQLLQDIPSMQLNSLLPIFIERGEKGLDQLITLVSIDKPLFKMLHEQVFVHLKSDLPLIINKDYAEAIQAIQGFKINNNESLWWNTLLTQHCAAQKEVNLIDLVNAFKRFKEELAALPTHNNKPLDFPDQCALKDAKSMPVVLSRILTLLQHVKEQDRHLQWELAAELDWSSNGVIKAISDQSIPWNFITPEMQINAQREINYWQTDLKGRISQYGEGTLREVNPDDTALLLEQLYRYTASRNKTDILPLEFYSTTVKKIQATSFQDITKNYFLLLVFSSTTTDEHISEIRSLDQATNSFDELLKLLTDLPFVSFILSSSKENIRRTLLVQLINLGFTPPLFLTVPFVNMLGASINILNLKQSQKKLENAHSRLTGCLNDFNLSVWNGMKYYSGDDYQNQELYFQYLEVVEAIAKKYPLHKTDKAQKQTAEQLIQIISLFHLQTTDIDALVDITQETTRKTNYAELLTILSRVVAKKIPAGIVFTANDLTTLLNNVKNKSATKKVIDVIKEFEINNQQVFANCFPDHFLARYGKTEILNEVLIKLRLSFNQTQQDLIQELLYRFTSSTDSQDYDEKIVQKIITICKPLSPLDKNTFIKKIAGYPDLCPKTHPLNNPENQFVKLLDAISNQGVDPFINFMHQAKLSAADINLSDELARKAVFYINTALPQIRKIPNLHLDLSDCSLAMSEIILKTQSSLFDNAMPQSTVMQEVKSINRQEEVTQLEAQIKTVNESVIEPFEKNFRIDFNEVLTKTKKAFKGNEDQKITPEAEAYCQLLADLSHEQNTLLEKLVPLATSWETLLILKKYNDDKDSIPESRKGLIADALKKDPSLASNIQFMPFLKSNPTFLRALVEENVSDALSSPDCLDDKDKLDLVFAALGKDLQRIADFEKQTTTLVKTLSDEKTDLYHYSNVLTTLIEKINNIVTQHPSCKKCFLELVNTYLQNSSGKKETLPLLPSIFRFITFCEKFFKEIPDKGTILSLCVQFNGDFQSKFTPVVLYEFFEQLESTHVLEMKDKLLIIKIVSALIDNNKGYDIEANFRLILAIKQDLELVQNRDVTTPDSAFTKVKPSKLIEALTVIYQKAPTPMIDQVLQWHNHAKTQVNAEAYHQEMLDQYNAFVKNPCKRKPHNAFDVNKAEKQLTRFRGLETGAIDPTDFANKIKAAKELALDQLVTNLHQFKQNSSGEPNYYELVAYAAELLYRSKGKDGEGLGSSMEINTTQYLAILSMLKTPGHVTSQIATGEGKTRIMMITLACQYALGNTVDFVTADLQLATRDFVEFKPYFDLLGAKTSMIFANTPPHEYQINDGINFSDTANLSLFRNQARSKGQEQLVINPDAKKRALVLDEADKPFYDLAFTRFNFSTEADDTIRDMPWVYRLLMDYFAQKEVNINQSETTETSSTEVNPIDLYYDDADLSRTNFLQYAYSRCTKTEQMRLNALSNDQIEEWQGSAINAQDYLFNLQYVVEVDTLITVPTGPKVASEVQVLADNQIAKGSKFSAGVDQCLKASLNQALQNSDDVTDLSLKKTLEQCEHGFEIVDQKQIIYSSTSKDFLDDYKEGELKAVTGTPGSIIEKKEAEILYKKANDENMRFISVPPHNTLKRNDKGVILTKNQLRTLTQQIKQARAKNQPILVIAEDDRESDTLFKELEKDFNNIQRVCSTDDPKLISSKIASAGKSQQITISTGMIGRGTDIKLDQNASTHGLNVMLTFLPCGRDMEQIIGRSGRFGAPGETALILDKNRTEEKIGQRLSSAYFENPELFIQREQTRMDKQKQNERIIQNTQGDFIGQLAKPYFQTFIPAIQDQKIQKESIVLWMDFYAKSQRVWNEKWAFIRDELTKTSIDSDKINALFNDYKEKTQTHWNTLRQNANQAARDKLVSDIPDFNLTEESKNILTMDIEDALSSTRTKRYNQYYPSHDGRVTNYTRWSIPVIAFLKGYANLIPGVQFDNARVPFANFRASLAGTGQLFPNFRTNPNKAAIIGGVSLGLIGAGIAVGLVLTGIFPPLGLSFFGLGALISTAIILAHAGLICGALLGITAGKVIDDITADNQIKKRTPVQAANTKPPREKSPLARLGGAPTGDNTKNPGGEKKKTDSSKVDNTHVNISNQTNVKPPDESHSNGHAP